MRENLLFFFNKGPKISWKKQHTVGNKSKSTRYCGFSSVEIEPTTAVTSTLLFQERIIFVAKKIPSAVNFSVCPSRRIVNFSFWPLMTNENGTINWYARQVQLQYIWSCSRLEKNKINFWEKKIGKKYFIWINKTFFV